MCIAIGFLVVDFKYDKSFADKPGLLSATVSGLIIFLALGIAFLILSGIVQECPNCNIIVGDNYCNECGYQVRTTEHPQKLFCSECGVNINADANFCGNCGKEVKE